MLSEYKASGALNSIAEQGQIRQEKFDGLRKFRFRVLIHLLPVILQLSLALFLIGVVVFLWEMHTGVAMVVFLPVVAGFVAYITSLIIALQHNHSPFQTSVSRAIRLLYYHALELRSSARPMANELTSSVQHAQLGWHAITRRISRFMQGMELWNHLFMSPHLFTTSFRGLIGQREDAESDVRSEKRGMSVREKKDITKASCVTWLLERAGSSQVQMLALNAIPLLPPHAVRPFLDQPNILRRCLYLYNSNLHRRPGQVKYLPDESQTATAIVAGTAIYHVMKSREENDSTHSSLFELAGDPDLFDIVESPDLTDEIDFQLITVIHCVQSQVGVDVWDINLLLRLLKKCSHKITSGGVRDAGDELEIVSQKPSSTNTPTQDSHILPSSQDLGSVGLLLDSIIWCSSQLDMGHPGQPILQTCSHQFEDILETLPNVLEKRKSVMLSSHAAIAISAVQWYKAAYVLRRTDPQTLGLEFGGVRRGQIRSAWFEVDKA
ncbi:hypothetical protein FRC03_004014 [Tulasnella sp. 419]|nr:hypothetical protein FRC03_004014 [Tulasnella sp. 419]